MPLIHCEEKRDPKDTSEVLFGENSPSFVKWEGTILWVPFMHGHRTMLEDVTAQACKFIGNP